MPNRTREMEPIRPPISQKSADIPAGVSSSKIYMAAAQRFARWLAGNSVLVGAIFFIFKAGVMQVEAKFDALNKADAAQTQKVEEVTTLAKDTAAREKEDRSVLRRVDSNVQSLMSVLGTQPIHRGDEQ